jgi:3-oxoacyl-[acyl-carrier-protein] synthase-3
MNEIFVNNFSSALGSRLQDVGQAEAAGQLVSTAAALREAGFEYHRVCTDEESAFDLAARAFEQAEVDASLIDAIVYATCLPLNGSESDEQLFRKTGDVKHIMQFPASRLQSRYDLHKAFIVGLNQQACTGMLGSLRIARNLLVAEDNIDNVLCITADRFPEGARYEQSYNLISDGAAACVVSRNPGGFRLLDIHHLSNGAMVAASDDETVGSYFSYVARLVNECLEKNAITPASLRWVVPQNTNSKAWGILARLLGINEDAAFFPSMKQVGHVISSDVAINLAELSSSGHLQQGDLVLSFMAGYGSNWQCALLEAA